MKYLPFENLNYTTNLKPQEIIERLAKNVEPKRMRRIAFLANKDHKEFEGKIEKTDFQIQRILSNSNNSFLPKIIGKIEEKGNETIINVKMKLRVFSVIMAIFFTSFFAFVLIAPFLFTDQVDKYYLKFIIPFFLFVLVYFLITWAFKSESNKAKKLLSQLFNTQAEEN